MPRCRVFAQAIEQVVRLHGLTGAGDQFEYLATQRRQPQATLRGGMLHGRDEAASVVVVVVRMSVGGVVRHRHILMAVIVT